MFCGTKCRHCATADAPIHLQPVLQCEKLSAMLHEAGNFGRADREHGGHQMWSQVICKHVTPTDSLEGKRWAVIVTQQIYHFMAVYVEVSDVAK